MLPALTIVEIMVIFFCLSKGFIKVKIKAYIDIIKNRKHVSEKYRQLEGKKIISDVDLIRTLPDEIFFGSEEIASKFTNRIFNLLFSSLSKITKHFI